jgi:hypothetical protein
VDVTSLIVGLLVSCIGAGYVIYGRRQEQPVALICGLALSLLPWFMTNPWLLLLVCGLLMALPLRLRSGS